MSNLDLADGIIKNVRALVYKKENGRREFLLTMEPGPSRTLTLPGGCKDATDASLEAAMRRELLEELGLSPDGYALSRTDIVKNYKSLYLDPKSERFGKPVVIYVFGAEYNGREPVQAETGLQGVFWFPESEVLKNMTAPHMQDIFKEGVRLI